MSRDQIMEAVRALVFNALDRDEDSAFVDVRKEDFDALAGLLAAAQGRASS